MLGDCRWFQLKELEKQRLEGRTEWMLGHFLAVEVERILPLCQANAIELIFEKVAEDD